MKTKQTQQRPAEKPEGMDVSAWFQLKQHVARLESRLDKLGDQVQAQRDLKRPTVHGVNLAVDMETKRQMNIIAQALSLRSGEELSQIVLHAFIDLYEDSNGSITLPLMLDQVETVP